MSRRATLAPAVLPGIGVRLREGAHRLLRGTSWPLRIKLGGVLLLLVYGLCFRERVYDSSGEALSVPVGAHVVLALDANRSNGFRWVLADPSTLGPLRLLRTEYGPRHPVWNKEDREWHDAEEGEDWEAREGGTERWTFRATRPGEVVVGFAYVRPWEQRPPAETRQFRVRVRE